jgi:hypothetical protein
MGEHERWAKIGYDAYGEAADWKNYQGKPMPKWEELPENIRRYWRVAAAAIVENSYPIRHSSR